MIDVLLDETRAHPIARRVADVCARVCLFPTYVPMTYAFRMRRHCVIQDRQKRGLLVLANVPRPLCVVSWARAWRGCH